MNGVFTFVFLIVCAVLISGLIQTWMKQRYKARESTEDPNETLEKLAMLEERVRVLERIVTENKFDLKSEIDRL